MTYEDFVFALRGYDKGKIFQRKFFADLNLPDKPDEEILVDTKPNSTDTLETLQRKISILETLQKRLSDYQNHISRHIRRLEKFLHVIEQKGLVDTSTDIATLREKHRKALTLIFIYSDAVWWSENPSSEKINVFVARKIPVTKILDSLYVGVADNLKELYKAERNYYRKIFAERLKAARKEAGLTQSALANRTGLTQRNISDYENMLYEPNLIAQVNLSRELRKPVGWFIGVN